MKLLKYSFFLALAFVMFGKIVSQELDMEIRLRLIKDDFEEFKNRYKAYSAHLNVAKSSEPPSTLDMAASILLMQIVNYSFMEAQRHWKLSDRIFYASSLNYYEQNVLNPALKKAGLKH